MNEQSNPRVGGLRHPGQGEAGSAADRAIDVVRRLRERLEADHAARQQAALDRMSQASRRIQERARDLTADLERRRHALLARMATRRGLLPDSEGWWSFQRAAAERLTGPSRARQHAQRLESVLGAERAVRLLHDRFVLPFREPERALVFGQSAAGGVLLFGPPGCGKATLARALACELGVPIFEIEARRLEAISDREAEVHVAEVFSQALRSSGAVVFIDDLECLAPRAATGGMARAKAQLVDALRRFASAPAAIMVVAATARPWELAPDLLSRGGLDAMAFVGLPGTADRAAALAQALVGVPTAPGLDWTPAALALDGCSTAEVKDCARRAARAAFADSARGGRGRPVDGNDLHSATSGLQRMVTPSMLDAYAAFALRHGAAGPGPDIPGATEPAPPRSDAGIPFEPLKAVRSRDLAMDMELLPFISYAVQHAGIPPIRSLTVTNRGLETSQNLVVEVALVPSEYGDAWRCNIPELGVGESWNSGPINLPLRLERLRAVAEKEGAHLRVSVRDRDEELIVRTESLPVLAYNEWVYLPQFLQLTAAFVQPNSAALHPVVQAAAGYLEARVGSNAFPGYQVGSPEHVNAMLSALHDALQEVDLAYINPPPSFEVTGQKVRLVADTLAQRRGTCLDLSVLQAALWEHVGLHPLILIVPGHALLGCWTEARHASAPVVALGVSPSLGNDTPAPQPGEPTKTDTAAELLSALHASTWRVFNSVEITAGHALERAEINGLAIIEQTLGRGECVYVIDLVLCHRQVTPLP